MSDFTKKAIENTLYELVGQKPLGEITVTDIIETCGISRSTFYYHFHDMNDLIEWTITEHFNKILGKNRTYATWQDGFKAILHEVEQEKEYIFAIYATMDHSLMEYYLEGLVFKLLMSVLKEKDPEDKVSYEKKEFIVNFYKRGFIGITIDWVKSGMKQDPDELIDDLEKVMHGSFANALQAFEQK